MNPTKVFLVQGSAGEYEIEDWLVLAFLDRAEAEAHAKELQAESLRLLAIHERKCDRWREKYEPDGGEVDGAPPFPERPTRNRLDPRWNGEPTAYRVFEVDIGKARAARKEQRRRRR